MPGSRQCRSAAGTEEVSWHVLPLCLLGQDAVNWASLLVTDVLLWVFLYSVGQHCCPFSSVCILGLYAFPYSVGTSTKMWADNNLVILRINSNGKGTCRIPWGATDFSHSSVWKRCGEGSRHCPVVPLHNPGVALSWERSCTDKELLSSTSDCLSNVYSNKMVLFKYGWSLLLISLGVSDMGPDEGNGIVLCGRHQCSRACLLPH